MGYDVNFYQLVDLTEEILGIDDPSFNRKADLMGPFGRGVMYNPKRADLQFDQLSHLLVDIVDFLGIDATVEDWQVSDGVATLIYYRDNFTPIVSPDDADGEAYQLLISATVLKDVSDQVPIDSSDL